LDPVQLRKQVRRDVQNQIGVLQQAAESRASDFVEKQSVLDRITQALGETAQKLGLLIAMA
jgi:hypothetical protein